MDLWNKARAIGGMENYFMKNILAIEGSFIPAIYGAPPESVLKQILISVRLSRDSVHAAMTLASQLARKRMPSAIFSFGDCPESAYSVGDVLSKKLICAEQMDADDSVLDLCHKARILTKDYRALGMPLALIIVTDTTTLMAHHAPNEVSKQFDFHSRCFNIPILALPAPNPALNFSHFWPLVFL